jgi:hypothetical protein
VIPVLGGLMAIHVASNYGKSQNPNPKTEIPKTEIPKT